MAVVLGEPLIEYPDGLLTVTLKVPLLVKPLIGRVYEGPEPLRVPLLTPETPLKVMLLALKPETDRLKVRVNCVVVSVEEPLAVTPLNVTAILEGGV